MTPTASDSSHCLNAFRTASRELPATPTVTCVRLSRSTVANLSASSPSSISRGRVRRLCVSLSSTTRSRDAGSSPGNGIHLFWGLDQRLDARDRRFLFREFGNTAPESKRQVWRREGIRPPSPRLRRDLIAPATPSRRSSRCSGLCCAIRLGTRSSAVAAHDGRHDGDYPCGNACVGRGALREWPTN